MAGSKKLSGRDGARKLRQKRVRRKIRGTDERPRLCVYRSLKYTYAQILSDDTGAVLVACSTRDLDSSGEKIRPIERAKQLGKKIAELAKEKSINTVVFDRNGYVYHGRVAAVAAGAREAGLAL